MIRAEALESRSRADAGGPTPPERRLRWEPVLSADEERDLAERIRGGDEDARQELILANLRMVVEIARRFRGGRLPLDDLVQEGNLGLIRASADFDPAVHGCRFYTYAEIWINAFIHRAFVSNGSLIRIPKHLFEQRKQGRRARGGPRQAEVADERAGAASPTAIEDNAGGAGLGLFGLDPSTSEGPASDPGPVASEAEIVPLTEMIVDDHPPDQQVAEHEQRILLELALRRLSPVEAWVIRERYGLCLSIPEERGWSSPLTRTARQGEPEDEADGYGSRRAMYHRTYHELGRACGLSHRRILQVEQTALEKLRDVLGPCLAQAL